MSRMVATLSLGISQLGQRGFSAASPSLSRTQLCNVDPFKASASELQKRGIHQWRQQTDSNMIVWKGRNLKNDASM
jgi:hypothetical protein